VKLRCRAAASNARMACSMGPDIGGRVMVYQRSYCTLAKKLD